MENGQSLSFIFFPSRWGRALFKIIRAPFASQSTSGIYLCVIWRRESCKVNSKKLNFYGNEATCLCYSHLFLPIDSFISIAWLSLFLSSFSKKIKWDFLSCWVPQSEGAPYLSWYWNFLVHWYKFETVRLMDRWFRHTYIDTYGLAFGHMRVHSRKLSYIRFHALTNARHTHARTHIHTHTHARNNEGSSLLVRALNLLNHHLA